MVQESLDFSDLAERPISPYLELGAYEALWDTKGATFKRLADRFRAEPKALPSDFVEPSIAIRYSKKVQDRISSFGVTNFGVRVHKAGEYPPRLRDAEHPVELLYYSGWWELVNSPRSVAVVGTRKPTDEGVQRAKSLVKRLVEDDFTIVSGLAAGIDTVVHQTAIESGGRTIGVLGTPLNLAYPRINESLQRRIANEHLLVSQVPFIRYERAANPAFNNGFFPERNKTMSALTDATIIVEAGETSGTLVQARAALSQKRKLLILENCFRNRDLSWPTTFEKRGALRISNYDEVRQALATKSLH